VIHARAADADMIRILEDELGKGAFPAVLHCFSSGPELARRGLALGFYLSMSGILTFKASNELRAIAKAAPIDRLLVETDAPYLAPVPHRGKRNEPAFTRFTAEVLAEVKGVSVAEIAEATTRNAERLFSRLPRLALAA
jgi:TatD DNase family protein